MAELKRENSRYVLETKCNHMTLLLPLTGIEIILPREELMLSESDNSMASYQNHYVPCFSLSAMMGTITCCEEPYAVLIHSDTIEFFLYVEHIENVKQVNNSFYKLPSYLQEKFTYITECHAFNMENIAYTIDIDKLLQIYHQRNEENTYDSTR